MMKRPLGPNERPQSRAAALLLSVALSPAALAQPPAGDQERIAPAPESAEADDRRADPSSLPSAIDAAPSETEHPLRRARDALLAADDPGGALEPAERLVEQPDPLDRTYADDLLSLAVVLTLLEDFDAAERRFFEAIDVIRAAEGEVSIALTEPYHALGKHYLRSRQFVEAIAALEQAQHVYQRNLGLFDVTQSDVIDDLTTAYLGLGDTATARRLQTERLDNAIRRFGKDDPRVVPFRYGLADYYERSRLRGAAREQYELAVDALESQAGADETVLLEPLRRLARIEIQLRDRDAARQRIADILDRNPEADPLERARSLVTLGDFALAREQNVDTALAHYEAAHALLEPEPAERDALLGRPHMLDFVAPLTSVDRGTSRRPYAWGTIVLGFDVSASGRALDVSVLSAEPAGIVDGAFAQRIREAHFRPRIEAGSAVPTAGVRYTHSFRYYVAR